MNHLLRIYSKLKQRRLDTFAKTSIHGACITFANGDGAAAMSSVGTALIRSLARVFQTRASVNSYQCVVLVHIVAVSGMYLEILNGALLEIWVHDLRGRCSRTNQQRSGPERKAEIASL